MTVLLIYCLVMLAVHFVVVAGIIRACRMSRRMCDDSGNAAFKVSVIIPARNEEKNLPMLFKSLEHNMDPDLEIILADDRSTDRTLRMMQFFASMHPNVKVISNTEEPGTDMNPKHHMLALAEKAATGDILMFTDADCIIPQDWVPNVCRYFQNPNVGLVFSTVVTVPGNSFLEKYQTYDHLLRFFYTVGAVGLGNPSGGFGNNLAVRRAALADVGGFEGIGFSLTEDAQLIASVRNTGKWQIAVSPFRETMVYAQPQKRYSDVLKQETRWSAGALYGRDKMTGIMYSFMLLFTVAGTVGLLGSMFDPMGLGCFTILIWGMGLVALTGSYYAKFDNYFRAFIIPCTCLGGVFYCITFLAAFFVRTVKWKGTAIKK